MHSEITDKDKMEFHSIQLKNSLLNPSQFRILKLLKQYSIYLDYIAFRWKTFLSELNPLYLKVHSSSFRLNGSESNGNDAAKYSNCQMRSLNIMLCNLH